ncbi:hypothetical protein [Bradyrhizobium elkanii]|nr:hypothetical protein [Bradyrhizobium elkanii]MCP1971622.1 hypothetical protein [Bradyrhizobium elkanii]MCS3518777.1 hypothetical protein [Bradyrhizobium elkanii]MCS4075335.1 hypothetical protein [Bradyrhizobium elkanii]MCS4081968.1 hypothetical protein [Bradyrhizobium elkanii]MCS4106872.1 hypothetical protein [Bradyrhizobium elkanii]
MPQAMRRILAIAATPALRFAWHERGMTVALRQQLSLRKTRPETSFGPFRPLPALPWLVMATAIRIVGFGKPGLIVPALVLADVCVLLAFFATARDSIQAAGGQSSLGELTLGEQIKLSLSILWRIVLVIIIATLATAAIGFSSFAPHLLWGLDGMAFDQGADLGRFWSAAIAALVLLIIVNAESNGGRVALFAAVKDLGRHALWLGAAVLLLGVINVALGYGQGLVRTAIWHFWQISMVGQPLKNLIYVVFIFSFAMLRLWITLSILTFGLKQSYARDG